MARFQRNFQRGVARPNRGWSGSIPAAATGLAANNKVILALFELDNDGIDETILRVVGGVAVASDQNAASESQVGAVGMCLVTSTAAAAGIASLPDPVTDVGDDLWLFFQAFSQEMRFADATGFAPNFASWYPFDQKAKRIVHSGTTVALIAANASATHGFNIRVVMRILSQVRGTR